ncbi:ankyrin repeat domain-containing protein 45-like isoform X2 [Watersipora subatra]|uniref:ankyrin repeat domain-containing protein 45-like isoform X2 n=1 Tax=Watersipora subatra TaxID=2589382 RepID=UPI00355B0B7D
MIDEEQIVASEDVGPDLSVNIAYQCAMKGSVTRFLTCFDSEEDPYHEVIPDQVNQRDGEARSPLDIAAALGRLDMVRELLARGAEVNSASIKGITALHRAADWGKIDVVKLLVENGADMQARTTYGERPRESAFRYKHIECVDYLDWAEAREALITSIQDARDTLADPEKVQGRFSRDDKQVTVNTCNEKTQWLEANPDATTNDFIQQRKDFEDSLAPIWAKLLEPPKTPQKK